LGEGNICKGEREKMEKIEGKRKKEEIYRENLS
jgi:hypothetical protein